ncbi:PP2C family protein-serine/threonine phosphatase [Streptacidiphilus jiangxiensis]|nr:PP2C family protein-serine/threonine phosphatase [Streptacidiphilus jiangxiensis]
MRGPLGRASAQGGEKGEKPVNPQRSSQPSTPRASTPRLSGSRPSTRLLVAVVGALASALTAGIALGGWFVHRDHERTVVQLTERWEPAQATLAQVRDAVDEVQADCLIHPPGDQAVQQEARRRLDAALPRLHTLVSDSQGLELAVLELSQTVERSVAAALLPGSASRCSAAVTAGDPAMAGVAAGATGPGVGDPGDGTGFLAVQSRADQVQNLLNGTVRSAQSEAENGATTLLLYVFGMCLAAVLAVVAGTALISSRVLAPMARIEAQLRDAAAGVPPGPATAPTDRGGLFTRLAREADRTRMRLAQMQWQSGRDQAALAQHGPAATGIHRILTSREDPGPGVVVGGRLMAAEGLIAGDYLGTLPLPGGRTALLVGDVSGHGVEAGLLAAQLKCAAQAAFRAGLDPVRAAHTTWGALAHEDERFTTLVLAVLDPATATLTWLNAGHEEPYLLRADGTVERLAPTGPLIHPFLRPTDDTWRTASTAFTPGDLLVLATDGLTEGRTTDGSELGDERVLDALHGLSGRDLNPAAAVEALLEAVRRHGVDWDRDDITVLAATTAPTTDPTTDPTADPTTASTTDPTTDPTTRHDPRSLG